MSVFEWNSSYSVGIRSIDLQHRKIIELIDELVESIRNSREDFVINEVLNDLTEYAHYHFSLEGKILKRYELVDEHDHEMEHRSFIERVKSLKVGEELHAGNIPRETLDYLENWFHGHELKSDKRYYEFLKANGLLDEIDALIQSGTL